MEPITINDSLFKGIRMLYSHLDEGIALVKQYRIKDICIRKDMDETRYIVNFDFLKDLDFIETLEVVVNLSKKSNLKGLYYLINLKRLFWSVDNVFDLDFSRLTTIEVLNTSYYKEIALESLVHLRELYISSVMTDDLRFLPELESVEQLRIISGKFTSLEGLEHFKNLKKLDLRRCFKLVHANATLQKLKQLESVVLDKSKIYDVDFEELKARVPHVWAG